MQEQHYEEISNQLEPLFDIQHVEHFEILQDNTVSNHQIDQQNPSIQEFSITNSFNCKITKPLLIDIRMYSRNGRRKDFIYQQSNVLFSKKNQIGKMRKVELMIPPNNPIERIIIEVEVEYNVKSLFGLQKEKESKVESTILLEYENYELQQNLKGIKEGNGIFFYLLPIGEKKGRNLGPKHRLRFSFYIFDCWYFFYIDSIYLAGHKHESGKKKKEIHSLVHNCFQLLIDTEFRSIHHEILNLKSKDIF